MRTFGIFIISFVSGMLAADFQTLDGTKYKGVTVKRVEADGIVVETDVGVEKVYFNELPNEVRERYNAQAAAAAAVAAASASETRTVIATTPVLGQGSGHGVADTIASTVKAPVAGASQSAPSRVTATAAIAPQSTPSPTPPVTSLHTYELKQDYVIGGDTGAVAKRLAKGQRYRGRDVPDGIQLDVDGKMYTVPRDILSAAKD
jgi:hypothetical protein